MQEAEKISWLKLMDRAPATIALASAAILVLSYIFQFSYFLARGSFFALGHLSVSDLLDHAGLAVSVCVYASSSFLLTAIRGALKQDAQKSNLQKKTLEELEDDIEAAQTKIRKVKRKLVGSGFICSGFGLALCVLYGWSWTLMLLAAIPLAYLIVAFILLWFSDAAENLIHRRDVSVLFYLGLAALGTATLAALSGAHAHDCPRPIDIQYSNGKSTKGFLIGALNRGVVFEELPERQNSIIPWSQIIKLNEHECKLKNEIGLHLPWK